MLKREAEYNKTLVKKTIYDNPLLGEEQINRLIKEMGGITAPKFQREYLCITIRDEENTVFPEFNDELISQVVKEWPLPPFYDCYEAMDLGYNDLTALVFGYYDFRADKIIICDELVVKGRDLKLPQLVDDIKTKEEKLWTNIYTNEVKKPYMRVSDINYIVTQEISRLSKVKNYGINFTPAKKDDNHAAINNVRSLLSVGKIIIDPKCVTLIRHLRNCKWSNTKKETFARSPDDGHYDAVDALKYLVRHVLFSKNPYPAGFDFNLRAQDAFYSTVGGKIRKTNPNTDIYQKIYNTKGMKKYG